MKIIKYQFVTEVNYGTDEEPNIVQTFHEKTLGPMSDNVFEANYAIAQKEAYGEITVEDVPDEDTPPTQIDLVEAQATYTAMMTGTLLEV